ncbi:MAG: ATP-binding cassette domain-containing protein, partial [Firmicutes bacterium]|nr:ATP-binding cassette domain-containing protein [Bacillota bacterium]
MEALTIRDFSFAYPNREKYALCGVNLTVRQGEFIVICGASGSGKTTLLRQLKPALAPHGEKSGELLLCGTPLDKLSPRDSAAKIGFVQQSVENQIVTDKVWHELAFGLESLGFDTRTIRLRTAEMASFFGIQEWFRRNVNELSGGQKQLLSLASVMAMQPELLILDEPTSQLDPIAASEFLAAVGKVNRELGVTVLLTEHRLEEAFALCSRAVVLDEGRILCGGTPREIGEALRAAGHGMFRAMPAPMRIWAGVENDLPCPVSVREGREWLDQCLMLNAECLMKDTPPRTAMPAIELKEAWFRYEKDLPDVIKGLDFAAYPGEITAVLGGNGAGKTTALLLMLGLHKPQRGKVVVHDPRIAAVPQNPQTLFVGKTVEEDLMEMLSERHIPKAEKYERIAEIARTCRLTALLQSHPYDLSGGEQQRAALAKVLLTEPRILLLDEPTKGLDAEFKQLFAGILRRLADTGVSVIMVSHDIEFCAEYADTCALFFDGGIVTRGATRAFFTGNSFYTTAANRMARHVLSEAVIANDVILALGGQVPPSPPLPEGGGANAPGG